jgi:hypothetical protein
MDDPGGRTVFMVNQSNTRTSWQAFFTKFWFLPAFTAYILIFWRSLVFIYIEGDDATSIAYHLLERNTYLQLPYSPYQGMMDTVMSLLPAQEQVLRVTGMGLSAIAGICFGYLLSRLVFEWNRDIPAGARPIIPLLILFCAPELLYLCLSYKPALLAIDLLICAHLVLRTIPPFNLNSTRNRVLFLISLVLFGVGVSFRWNTIVYGAVIAADLFFILGKATDRKQSALLCGGWGLSALFFSLAAIFLSNLNVLDISHAVSTMQSVLNQVGTDGSNAYLSMLLALSPLFTPGMVIAAVVGFGLLIYRKDRMWIVVAAGLLGVLPFIRSGSPKNLITFIPELALCFSVGISAIWNFGRSTWKNAAARTVILTVIFVPWVIGVRAVWGDTAWGPAFELKPYDRPENEANQFYPVIGTGSAFPTPGIPRPIYGYFDNLFGGPLKYLEQTLSDERSRVVDTAISENLPIVMTGWTPDYFVIELYKRGYVTTDFAYKESTAASGFFDRHFTDMAGHSALLIHNEVSDRDGEVIARKLEPLGSKFGKVILMGYPGSMRALYFYCPNAMTSLGAKSAVVDLHALGKN